MNLSSCDNCGTVVDTDKNKFPEDIYNELGCVDNEKAAWNGDEYVPSIKCPSCNEPILKE